MEICQSIWQGVPQGISAGEVLPSGLDVRTTTTLKNRRTFPDSRDLANGRIRGIVGGEWVRASQPFLMVRNIIHWMGWGQGEAALAWRPPPANLKS